VVKKIPARHLFKIVLQLPIFFKKGKKHNILCHIIGINPRYTVILKNFLIFFNFLFVFSFLCNIMIVEDVMSRCYRWSVMPGKQPGTRSQKMAKAKAAAKPAAKPAAKTAAKPAAKAPAKKAKK
jgi:hypothetical protein